MEETPGVTGGKKEGELVWTREALDYLEMAPSFVRERAKKRIEEYARQQGITEITEDVAYAAREKAGG
jgi:predicted transcriptional regulator